MQKRKSQRFNDLYKQDQIAAGNPKHKSDNDVKTGYSPEIFEKVKAYNQQFTTIDEKYAKLVFTQQVLVRCALIEPSIDPDSGFITVPQITVPMPTQMGIVQTHVEKHYAYSTYAVVVSENPHLGLHKGQIVQLDPEAANLIGRGNVKSGFDVKYVYQYKYPTYKETPEPFEPEDENFGYLLIEPRRIITVLPYETELEQVGTDLPTN